MKLYKYGVEFESNDERCQFAVAIEARYKVLIARVAQLRAVEKPDAELRMQLVVAKATLTTDQQMYGSLIIKGNDDGDMVGANKTSL